MIKKIVTVILILLILASVGLTVYGIYTGASTVETLPKAIIVICGAIISIVRMNTPRGRKALAFYESQYAEQIKSAFAWSAKYRKQLLSALRLYNEDALDKAAKKLIKLCSKCQNKDDGYAVYLFLGIIFTDMGLYEEAVSAYETIIKNGAEDATVYNNLGYIHMNAGDYDKAEQSFRQSIRLDPAEAQAYHNIARIRFNQYRFDEAIELENKALSYEPKMRQALAMLSIIYNKQNNKSEADKYFHMAVAAGEDAEALKNAIKRYSSLSEEDWNKEDE